MPLNLFDPNLSGLAGLAGRAIPHLGLTGGNWSGILQGADAGVKNYQEQEKIDIMRDKAEGGGGGKGGGGGGSSGGGRGGQGGGGAATGAGAADNGYSAQGGSASLANPDGIQSSAGLRSAAKVSRAAATGSDPATKLSNEEAFAQFKADLKSGADQKKDDLEKQGSFAAAALASYPAKGSDDDKTTWAGNFLKHGQDTGILDSNASSTMSQLSPDQLFNQASYMAIVSKHAGDIKDIHSILNPDEKGSKGGGGSTGGSSGGGNSSSAIIDPATGAKEGSSADKALIQQNAIAGGNDPLVTAAQAPDQQALQSGLTQLQTLRKMADAYDPKYMTPMGKTQATVGGLYEDTPDLLKPVVNAVTDKLGLGDNYGKNAAEFNTNRSAFMANGSTMAMEAIKSIVGAGGRVTPALIDQVKKVLPTGEEKDPGEFVGKFKAATDLALQHIQNNQQALTTGLPLNTPGNAAAMQNNAIGALNNVTGGNTPQVQIPGVGTGPWGQAAPASPINIYTPGGYSGGGQSGGNNYVPQAPAQVPDIYASQSTQAPANPFINGAARAQPQQAPQQAAPQQAVPGQSAGSSSVAAAQQQGMPSPASQISAPAQQGAPSIPPVRMPNGQHWDAARIVQVAQRMKIAPAVLFQEMMKRGGQFDHG